jgi:hypothetical protein
LRGECRAMNRLPVGVAGQRQARLQPTVEDISHLLDPYDGHQVIRAAGDRQVGLT